MGVGGITYPELTIGGKGVNGLRGGGFFGHCANITIFYPNFHSLGGLKISNGRPPAPRRQQKNVRVVFFLQKSYLLLSKILYTPLVGEL